MGIANDKEISPMMSSKVNEDKGKHWCYWHGPLPLCSLNPPRNHLNTEYLESSDARNRNWLKITELPLRGLLLLG